MRRMRWHDVASRLLRFPPCQRNVVCEAQCRACHHDPTSATPKNGCPTHAQDKLENHQSSSSAAKAKSFSEIPGPWPSLPFIGTGWQYFPWVGKYDLFKLHEANLDKYLQYGDIMKEEYQWRKPVVQLFNPDDFETVFWYQGLYPQRPVNEFLVRCREAHPEKYSGPGIANLTGKDWKKQRDALIPPMLKFPVFLNNFQQYNTVGDDFVTLLRSLRNGLTYCIDNLQSLAYRFSLESVFLLCLDSRLGCLDPEMSSTSDALKMISAVELMFEAFQKLNYGLPLWKYFLTPSFQKLQKAELTTYNTVTRYMERALRQQQSSGKQPSNQPTTLLESLCKNSDLTDLEIKVTIVDFVAGGIFTVSNTLCFLLNHLAVNPDVQERLYQEIVEVAPDGVVTQQSLNKLVYLKSCIKETFRLTPTVPGIMRILPQDLVLSGYHVPAGVMVCCHFMVTCQLKKYFPEPEKFYPDRWMGSNRKNIHPFCLLPFGLGTKTCLGRSFAEAELCLAAAKLVYNFRLECQGEGKVEMVHPFIIVPANSISILLHDRHHGNE